MSSSGERIRAVRALTVRVPRRHDLLPRTAHGETAVSEYALLQVETESGQRGLGEVTTSPRWNGEDAVGSADLIERVLAPRLQGIGIEDRDRFDAAIDAAFRGRPFLRAGLEMARLDAEARARGVRVADLLADDGAEVTETFATRIVLPARDTAVVESMARFALERGARRLKVKVGVGWEADLERTRAVRSLHTGALSVDANEGWTPAEVPAIASAVAELALAGVEQPFSRDTPAASAALQAQVRVPVIADESVWSERDLDDVERSRSFAAVSLYPGKLGGLRTCVSAAATARRKGLRVMMGSNLELGVGTAAMAHTLAAIGDDADDIGHDLIGPLYFESALVEDDSFVAFTGASLPPGPGLGVRLDLDAVDRHRYSGLETGGHLEDWG